MVKRIAWLLVPMVLLAAPLGAQNYTSLELGFGYANWGADVPNAQFTGIESRRMHGFAMHQTINLTSWFAIDNYLGAYSYPSIDLPTQSGTVTLKPTAIYNVFGVKLTARDLLDGAISPFVVAGFGGGSVSDRNRGVGFSSAAARYGGGFDINLNEGFAFRVDASNMAVGRSFVSTGWSSDLNVATSIILKLDF